jgi:hypothetical protein
VVYHESETSSLVVGAVHVPILSDDEVLDLHVMAEVLIEDEQFILPFEHLAGGDAGVSVMPPEHLAGGDAGAGPVLPAATSSICEAVVDGSVCAPGVGIWPSWASCRRVLSESVVLNVGGLRFRDVGAPLDGALVYVSAPDPAGVRLFSGDGMAAVLAGAAVVPVAAAEKQVNRIWADMHDEPGSYLVEFEALHAVAGDGIVPGAADFERVCELPIAHRELGGLGCVDAPVGDGKTAKPKPNRAGRRRQQQRREEEQQQEVQQLQLQLKYLQFVDFLVRQRVAQSGPSLSPDRWAAILGWAHRRAAEFYGQL